MTKGTKESPFVVEVVDDVGDLLSSPGYYQTASTFPAYSVVKALDEWHPLFRGGSELPFVEGNVFFFEVLAEPEEKLTQNPLVAMGVSEDFWVKMLQRYTNWELAWWREVVQNARDAGATLIELDIKSGVYRDIETGAETPAMVVSAYDNGSGMSADILRRALLTRGGSVKPESAVGGFGDAKNLILFPWYGWRVETNDLVAEGQHESIQEPPGIKRVSPGIKGTKITVWMPLDKTTAEDYALQLVERSYLSDVKIKINGKSVKADLIGGEEIARVNIVDDRGEKVGDIVAHHQPRSRTRSGVFVRARGVYMFDEKMFGSTSSSSWENLQMANSSENIPGVVYIDVNVPARFAFDASRNSLVGGPQQFVSRLLKKLVKEPEAVLRSKKHQMERVYRGTGSIEVREGFASETAAKVVSKVQQELAEKKAKKKDPGEEIAKDVARGIADAIDSQKRSEPKPETPEQEVAKNLASSRDTASALVMQTVPTAINDDQVAAISRLAVWQPDFFITSNIPFWKAPASVLPEKMAKKYLVQLRLWTELSKFALVQLGIFKPFGVGFVFLLDGIHGDAVNGAYKLHEGTDWLLMNPLTFKKGEYDYDAGVYKYESTGDRFDLSVTADLEDFCSLVVHEITHLQGFGDHDQAYASALTSNMKIAHRGLIGLARRMLPIIESEILGKATSIKPELDEEGMPTPKGAKKGREAKPLRVFQPFSGGSLNNDDFFVQFAMLIIAARFPTPSSRMFVPSEQEIVGAAQDLGRNFQFKYMATGNAGEAMDYTFTYYSDKKMLVSDNAKQFATLSQLGRKAFFAFIAQIQKLSGKEGQRVADASERGFLGQREKVAALVFKAYEQGS